MTKEKLEELMDKYLILDHDIEYMCEFCSELLEERAKDIEKSEPYAVNAIKRYKEAAHEVYDLIEYIDEICLGDDE